MNSILTIIFIVLYVYTLTTTISVLLLENRNPVKSLSWVLVLLFLPGLGLFLYLIFGQNFRKQKTISKKSLRFAANRPHVSFDIDRLNPNFMDNNQLNLIRLLYTNSDAKAYPNNKIDILSDGKTTFDAMFNAIQNAKNHIHIEFFIFGNDKISNQLRELLIEKASSGVRVRMIYDYWGSFFLSRWYLQTLREAGVYLRPFLPLRLRFGRSKINYRNHRKILIVDGEVGFTGGLNVADRYIFGNALGMWRDTLYASKARWFTDCSSFSSWTGILWNVSLLPTPNTIRYRKNLTATWLRLSSVVLIHSGNLSCRELLQPLCRPHDMCIFTLLILFLTM